ncbi:MAG: undecaprenyl-diphosphate phosphatase [Pseudomonadota bacterium]
MPVEQLIVLALIQGLTEFLPISSSAHLILAPALTAWEDQGPLIDVAAHLGSLGAVLLYFRSDVAALFRGAFGAVLLRWTDDTKLFAFVAAATVPVIAAAAVLVLTGTADALRSPLVIAWSTIVFGVLLYWSDKAGETTRGMGDLTWGRVAAVGLAQALALIPGASRSGVTITAARFLGFARPEAARFSMLLAIPTILAFGAFSGLELLEGGDTEQLADAGVVAALSFVSAYGAIFLFMKMLQRMSLTPFVLYRMALGVGLLIYSYAGGA